MKNHDLTSQEIAVWNGYNSFKSHFRKFIVSKLDTKKTGNWEKAFYDALYNPNNTDLQVYWKRDIKYLNPSDYIELIDSSHIKQIFNNPDTQHIFESISKGKVYQLKNWVFAIIEVRNKMAHGAKPSSREIGSAWNYMEEIAICMNDKDFEKELVEKKNNITKQNKELEDRIRHEILDEISKNQIQNVNGNDGGMGRMSFNQKLLLLSGFLVLVAFFLYSTFTPKSTEVEHIAKKTDTVVIATTPSNALTTPLKRHLKVTTIANPPLEKEDYTIFLNSSVTNSDNNIDVSVMIIDDKTHTVDNSLSNSIAETYTKYGKMGHIGLIRNTFIKKREFQELLDGNSDVIGKLKLNNYTDYLAIGDIKYSFRAGSVLDNPIIVCDASISISIISASTKTISRSFTITAIGNGVTEPQAQEYALHKLISKYNCDYSSL